MTAITIVGTATTNAALGTSWAITLPSTVQSGDVLLFGAYKENSATVTLPSGEGYSAADPTQNAEANGTNFWSYWYKADLQAADASATHTFSWTGSVWRQAAAIILRGASAIASQLDTDPPAAQIDTTTTSGTVVCPADTSGTADDLAVWLALTFDSLGSTWPATNDGNTVTERFDDTNNVHMATAPYPAAGTVSSLSATKSAATGQDTGKTFLVKASATSQSASDTDSATETESTAQTLSVSTSGMGALRPLSDISSGSWTPSAGGSLFAMLNETGDPNDTTFILSSVGVTSDVAEVSLGTPSAPLDLTGTTGRLSYRYQGSVQGGRRVDLTVQLLCNGSVLQTWTHPAIQHTWLTATQTISAAVLATLPVPLTTPLSLRFTKTQV